MIDHIARRCPFDLFFLSTISYTRASTFYYRYSIEQQVLSSLWCPQRRTFFLRFFLFEPSYIYTYIYILTKRSFLVNYTRYVFVSLLCYTPWGVCRYLIVVSCLHALRTQAWDAYSEMNMLLKKRIFFLFFSVEKLVSHPTRDFTPWYIHSSQKNYIQWRLFYYDVVVYIFSFFLPFFFFLFFLFHLIILQ